MNMIVAAIAGLLLASGGACFYFMTPHQRLLAAPLRARAAAWAVGCTALASALAILLSLMGVATAVFTWTVGLMMVWTILPVIIGWLRYRGEARS